MARLRTEKAMRRKRRFRFRFDEKGAETRLDEGDEEMLSADDAAYYRPSLRAASAWLLLAAIGKTAVLSLFEALYGLLGRIWPTLSSAGTALEAELFYKIVLVATPAWLYMRRDNATRHAARLIAPERRALPLTALAAVIVVPFAAALGGLWARLIEALGGHVTAELAMPVSIGGALLQLAVYALLPAVCEELLFRGGVMSAWERRGRRRALIVQAALFALIHESAQGFPVQLVLGLVLGRIVMDGGSVYAGMLFHGLYNALTLIWSWMLQSKYAHFNAMSESAAAQLGLTAAGALALMAVLYRLRRGGVSGEAPREEMDAGTSVLLLLSVLKMLSLGVLNGLSLFGVI